MDQIIQEIEDQSAKTKEQYLFQALETDEVKSTKTNKKKDRKGFIFGKNTKSTEKKERTKQEKRKEKKMAKFS